MKPRIEELARQLAALRAQKDSIEAALKDVNAQIDELAQHTIPQILEDAGVESVRVEGIGTLYVDHRFYASVLAGNRDELVEWLRSNGFGDIVKETVAPATLTAFAKEQVAQGSPLPDFIKTAVIPTARIRK